MPSRSERHERTQTVKKRVSKNQGLYEDLRRYKNYVEVSDIESVIEKEDFDLSEVTGKRRRSQNPLRQTQPVEPFSSLFMMDEPKEHDINKILTEAKQLRSAPDEERELEEKRKLKKEEYNITSRVDINKLEEIKEKRKNSEVERRESQELSDIIDTIYSKGLKEEINRKRKPEEDLFSDLLPASNEETLIDENLSKEIIAKEEREREEKEKEEQVISKKIESSFFTKSTELNPKDLVEEEDDDPFIEDKPMPVWAIILIVIAILAVVGFAGFWIYKSML